MSVSKQLLADLVSAYEASQKLKTLKKQLLAEAPLPHPVSFRSGSYNILVGPSGGDFMRHPVALIVRVVNGTEQVNDVEGVEIGAHGAESCAYRAKPSDRLVETVEDVLSRLEGGFPWYASPQGRTFWVDICNQLRRVVRRPDIT